MHEQSVEELLTRGVANIIPSKEALKKALQSGKKLNIYLGIDPTATNIHLGHAVPLRQLQKFAELGHNVTFLIGDFTALIGDTSDKDTERPVLTPEQIRQNFQTYKAQAEKVLDFSKIQVKYNSEWLKSLTFEDIIKLCQHFSFGDFASRELIKKRLQDGKHVGLHEALYPVMQGYDSYYMDTDIQLGGTDQTFNMQAGRILQKDLRDKESFVMTNLFLMGTDGRKMSKSWGNAIWLNDTPEDMYAKAMAVDDSLIIEYFTLGTELTMEEIKNIEDKLAKNEEHPLHAKKKLAFEIVKELHNEESAKKAQEHFEKTIQQGQLPENIEEVALSEDDEEVVNEELLADLNLASSKSDAKRLFQQGGVEVDGKRITDTNQTIPVKNEMIIKVGKRRIVRLKTAK